MQIVHTWLKLEKIEKTRCVGTSYGPFPMCVKAYNYLGTGFKCRLKLILLGCPSFGTALIHKVYGTTFVMKHQIMTDVWMEGQTDVKSEIVY